ncbi:dihydroxyacetone kinase subunit DhaL [Rhodococcus sp. JS3073]|uniref:dihydroxyacetone kinase subunit DhaL n=1 Tax=Rhodococcus sp. JS3073 TaxID=3002901 RepID=UPI00228661F5|nr:dihydroxyacetone kinase subunit DhaL [Rhodococcus sp. JS3073]WAM19073.1 dihydroxyacetone kinase subunit DhaL [Rhodococcus sp. JS3073]
MTSTTTTALPTTFAPRWVTAMLTTVLGTSAGGGAATSLGELDRQAGDGDFGTNLTSAFTRVQDEIQATSPQTFASWLTAVSRGFLGTGGTSGPLFGMFFRDIARCSTGDSPTLTELAAGLAKAVATVQRYGKAQVGHKTMVDALVPAAQKLSEQAAANVDPALALTAAVEAAQAGALTTRNIVARRGRASYVGEVSRGVLDPGAVAAALMIQCAAAAVDGHDGPVDTAWTR